MIRDREWIFTAQAAAEPVGILNELQHLKETGVKDIVFNTCLPMDYPALHDPERDLINAGAYVILEVNKNYLRTKERKTIAKVLNLIYSNKIIAKRDDTSMPGYYFMQLFGCYRYEAIYSILYIIIVCISKENTVFSRSQLLCVCRKIFPL